MKNPFPTETKQYVQNNRSNINPEGNVWSSFNLDTQTNVGVLRVSPRWKLNTTTNNTPVAFARFGQRVYSLAGTTIYRQANNTGLPNSAFVADTSTSASTDYSSDVSDMTGSWNTLWATAPTKLRSLSNPEGGTWSDKATISSNLNHKLVYFKKFDRLYFSDQSIKSINEAGSIATSGNYFFLGFNTSAIIDMKASSQFIWIAVKNTEILDNGGEVWQWDGISAQMTNTFKFPGSRGIVAIVIDRVRDLPLALSDRGILYEFNGSGFVEVDRLPYGVATTPYMGTDPYGSSNVNDRFVHPNGIIFTKNATVQVLVNGVNQTNALTQNENLASGIWERSEANGFMHVGSVSYDPIVDAITDFGQEQVSRVGALFNDDVASLTSGRDGTHLSGVTVFTNATSTSPAIFYDNSNDTIQKKGYVVMDWFESKEIADKWERWWMSYRRFLDANDLITVKYREVEEAPVSATITWVNTTTFTVLNSAVDVSLYFDANVSTTGGEVEILRGTGGGSCAHIIGAVNNAGTWTVTLDEAITGVTTGTAIGRFQKWKKIFYSNAIATPANWEQFAIGVESQPRLQMKICFTYTGNGEYYKGAINSTEDIKITA